MCHMCDECRHFQTIIDGLCGWRPGKLQKEKCEEPWIISKGIIDETNYITLEKKRRIIEILKTEYNYRVVDDSCGKKQDLDWFLLVIIGTNSKIKIHS